jgi:sporulation protein YlmC with PRC-barrel domain
MAKPTLYGLVIVASALTSLPVLAQTSTGAASSTPPSMAAGSSAATPAPATTPVPAEESRASAPTYYTADHELRASKLVGASVYDDQDKSIGSISDVLLNDSDHKAGMVVISVGGFLGVGSKLVSVPFDQVKVQDNKVVMPGATKASLESMPSFTYDKA